MKYSYLKKGVPQPLIDYSEILDSLDGELRAPVATILSETWTDKERAAFGVYPVTETEVPAGKRIVSSTLVAREGYVEEILELEDLVPLPSPLKTQLNTLYQLIDVMVESGALTITRANNIKNKLNARAEV